MWRRDKPFVDPARGEIASMAWERSGYFLPVLSRFLALSPRRSSSHPRSRLCPCLSVMLNYFREDTECFIADPNTMTLPLIRNSFAARWTFGQEGLELKLKERTSGVPFYWPHLDFLSGCLYAPAITDPRCVDWLPWTCLDFDFIDGRTAYFSSALP